MIKKITTLFLCIIVTACAVKPAKMIPIDYKYDSPVKIGYISMISERPTQSHIGVTVFGNFVKDLDVKWHLNEFIFETLSNELKSKKDYDLVNLSAMEGADLFFDNPNLVLSKGEFTDVNDKELKRIIREIGYPDLDAVIVVRSLKVFYNKDFDRILESRGKQGDHGFKSRTGEGMTFNSALGINMYSVQPKPHYVGWQYLGLIGQKVSPQPADYENLTTQELASYESQLKNNIKSKISEFILKTP